MNLKAPSNLLPFLLTFMASGWCYTWGQTVPAELTAQEIGVRSVVVQDDAKKLLAVWASNAPANVDIYKSGSTKRYGQLELPPSGSERIVGIRFGTKAGEGIEAISSTGLWMRWLVAGGLPSETKQLDAAKGLKTLTRFSTDGTWAVCATFDGWSAWNLATGEKIADSDTADGATQEIVILRNGNAFLSVGTKGATWFDVQHRTALKRIANIKIRTGNSKCSVNNKYVAGHSDDKVHIFEVDAMLADYADFKPETVGKGFSFSQEDYLMVSNFEQNSSPIDAWNLKGGLKGFRFSNPVTGRTNGSFTAFPQSHRIAFVGVESKTFPKHEGILVKQIDDKNPYSFGKGSIQSSRSSDVKYPFIGVSAQEEYMIVNSGNREVQIWHLDDCMGNFQVKDGRTRISKSRPSGAMIGTFELPNSIDSARWYLGDEFVVLKLEDDNEFLMSLKTGFDRFESTLISMRPPEEMAGSMAFQDIEYSADGKLIIVHANTSTHVLETERGKEVYADFNWFARGWLNYAGTRMLLATSSEWQNIELSTKAKTTISNLPQGKFRTGSHLGTKVFINKKLSIIDPDQPAVIRSFDRGPGGPIDMSPDFRRVAIAGQDSDGTTVEIFDVESGESFSKINVEKDGVYDLAFVGDGGQIAVCGGNKIRIYDYKRSRLITEFPKETKEPKRIDLGGKVGTQVMQKIINRLSSQGLIYNRRESPFGAMDYDPASNRIAVCRDNFLEIWDLASETVLFRIRLEASRGTAIAFSPDGKSVAVGQEDQWIQILKLPVK